ncbi:hypothetical protein [Trueperella pyogenes]|uniref:hypothetical protein n=1 Tax=Trueperella pyogenes TaxID=1661 RepID=UPI00345D1923
MPPLRPLTPETSRGFELISFASDVLGIELYPWQKWLAIHALEIHDDGTYRFRKILVLVARQNGKTTFASVLAAWWLFVDSHRFPQLTKPSNFKIVGTAQNLDIARVPYSSVMLWSDPEPPTEDEAELAIPALQASTNSVSRTNGKERIVARGLAHYEIRAAGGVRGKPAARVLMDELREQKTWAPWNAVSQTAKSFFNGQIWSISNAGDASSVVLKHQYDAGLNLIESFTQAAAEGKSPQEWADDADPTIGTFVWSAPDGCPTRDVDGILAANPSIGYGPLTVETCLSDETTMLEADFRTEVLCQWVPAAVESYIDVREWAELVTPSTDIHIEPGARTVWGIDTSADRSTTYVAAAVRTTSGRPFVTVREARPGSLWVQTYMRDLAEKSGHREVCIQARGAPAMEFIEPLKNDGLDVHEISGSWFGIATGRLKDRVRERGVIIVDQPAVNMAVSGGITKKFGETDAWSRTGSPVDISPLIAMTLALYGLEALEPDASDLSAYEERGMMFFM